jgi:hypothetical protein
MFILTKENPARLFKSGPNPEKPVLTEVGRLETNGPPTDMAISDDGLRLLALTYTAAFEFSVDLKQQQKIGISFLQQQESIAYLPGSRSFLYTTERLLPGLPQLLMRVDCAD